MQKILTANEDKVCNGTLKFSVIDKRHSNSEVLVLVHIAEARLWHVDALQKLVTMVAARQMALFVHAETTNTHAVVLVT